MGKLNRRRDERGSAGSGPRPGPCGVTPRGTRTTGRRSANRWRRADPPSRALTQWWVAAAPLRWQVVGRVRRQRGPLRRARARPMPPAAPVTTAAAMVASPGAS